MRGHRESGGGCSCRAAWGSTGGGGEWGWWLWVTAGCWDTGGDEEHRGGWCWGTRGLHGALGAVGYWEALGATGEQREAPGGVVGSTGRH